MNPGTRIYYLRNRDNAIVRADMSHTRGDPVAVIMTEIDAGEVGANPPRYVVNYAIAAVHPKDKFVKAIAKRIASGRLKTVSRSGKAYATGDRGTLFGQEISNAVRSKDGHWITTLVMRRIFASKGLSENVRGLAGDWLALAADARNRIPAASKVPTDMRETIPIPKDSKTIPSPMPNFEGAQSTPYPVSCESDFPPDYRGLTNGEIARRQATMLPPPNVRNPNEDDEEDETLDCEDCGEVADWIEPGTDKPMCTKCIERAREEKLPRA